MHAPYEKLCEFHAQCAGYMRNEYAKFSFSVRVVYFLFFLKNS